MTYNVFGGTLSLTQSINHAQSSLYLQQPVLPVTLLHLHAGPLHPVVGLFHPCEPPPPVGGSG